MYKNQKQQDNNDKEGALIGTFPHPLDLYISQTGLVCKYLKKGQTVM